MQQTNKVQKSLNKSHHQIGVKSGNTLIYD